MKNLLTNIAITQTCGRKTKKKYCARARKQRMISCFNSIVAVIFMLNMISCSKDEELQLAVNGNKTEQMAKGYNSFTFSSADEMRERINAILAMDSIGEIAAYEDSHGYTSLGRLADEFYETFDDGQFSTAEESEEYIKNHAYYLDIVDGVDPQVLPICCDNPFRYFAGNNGIFRIGNSVVKVFRYGNVITNITNLERLEEITEKDLNSIKSDTAFVYYPIDEQEFNENVIQAKDGQITHDHCYDMPCGSMVSSPVSTNGNKRIKVSLHYFLLPVIAPNGIVDQEFTTYRVTIRTEKKGWRRWKLCKDKIYGSINIASHVTSSGGNAWNVYNYVRTINGKKGKPLGYTVYSGIQLLGMDEYRLHLTSTQISAHTNSAGPATLNLAY